MPRTADKYSRKRIEVALGKSGVEPWKAEKVYARIEHDRWLADCPCNGAELVEPNEPMVCGSCGAVHEVEFPSNAGEIIEQLEKRSVGNRHWYPGETVKDLVAENIDHGVD